MLSEEVKQSHYFIELTTPFEDVNKEAFERKTFKHAELVEEARERNEARTHKTSGNRC